MSNKILNKVQLIQKVILVKDGLVLTLKRSPGDDCRANRWDLPGGRYEAGEDVLSAIKREASEEVGVKLNSLIPIYVASGLNFPNELMRGDTVFAICYLSSSREGEVRLSEEHVDSRWVTPNEFLTLDFGDDGGFFSKAMKSYISLPSPI